MYRKTVSGIVLMLLLTTMLSSALVIQPVEAKPVTWTVDDDLQDYPGADFTTIQDAVNAAAHGDSIIVYPGTYIENVDVNKSLTIQSQYGPDSTVVQAANYWTDSLFEITVDHVTISGLTAKGEWAAGPAIDLSSADYCNIRDNIICARVLNSLEGIRLSQSSKNTIADNIVLDNIGGIVLRDSPDNILVNNIISDNRVGMTLSDSSNNTITDNVFTSNGIGVGGSYQNNIENNTVNGKPLVYLEGVADRTVTEAGQVVLVGCSNITVEGLTLSSASYSLVLWETSNSTIASNVLSNNSRDGIALVYSSGNRITHNSISDNGNGISLSQSWNNNITSNTISGNSYMNGIVVSGARASGNVIAKNTLVSNRRAVFFDYSSGNRFYLNNFVDNTENIYSLDSTNLWNSPKEVTYTYNGNPHRDYLGNYWSDYDGSDVNGDGIGDAPYSLDWPWEEDSYPLMERVWNYFIPPLYSLTIGAVGSGTTNPTPGSYMYNEGTVVPVDAIPDLGWMLDHWELDGIDVGVADPYHVTMYTDHSLTAHFVKGEATMVYVDPPSISTDAGESFTVNINIREVKDLYSYQVELGFNKTVLEPISVEEGPFIRDQTASPNGTLFLQKIYDDHVLVACVTFGRYPGVNGDGTLFTVTFNVTGAGTSSLPLYGSTLLDSTLMVISHDTADGYFYTPGAIPPPAFPDFSIKASPPSLTIQQGNADTSEITVTSLNGFDQQIQLNVLGVPPGVTATLVPDTVTPPPDGSTTSSLIVAVDTTATPGSYTLTVTGTNGTITHSTDIPLEVTIPPNEPPTCSTELQKAGLEIDIIDVEEFFDIYVGDSTDDTGIAQVRFSSDDNQDNHPTGEWTESYDWETSSGDWNASTKIKRWSFTTPGYKEVWAEVKDDINQTDKRLARIYVPGTQTPTCAIELQKKRVKIDGVDLKQFFDIYVGGSTDDAAIEQVMFSSDDSQDGTPTGEWTEWYDWDRYSGDWDAGDKIKKWSFDTPGKKEVWAMIEDSDGNVVWNHANIFVHPGYAIIVVGSAAPGTKRTLDHSANNAYRVLRNLGFDDNHIFYLNSEEQDVDGDGRKDEVDAPALLSYFTNAINEVRDKIGDSATPFIIYFVGHGVPDAFIFHENAGEEGFLYVYTPPAGTDGLQEMLDKFSNQVPMLIMVNSCFSGCFITSTEESPGTVSSANRIIITSAHDDQERLAFTWIRFSDRFWGYLDEGLNVREAFTRRATWGDNSHSWLDDNGDARGHPPNDLEDDGELATSTHIGVVDTENLGLKAWQFGWKRSPGELRVYDSQNRVTGLVNGEVKEEIPDSIYDEENEIVAIFSPSDTYHYEVVGTEEETYGLEIASINGSEAVTFNATDIPTSANTTHQYTIDWDALSLGEKGVTVQIDSDGDGVSEHTFTSDSELSHSEYVNALDAINTWITDSDFNEIESFRAVFTPYGNTELYKLTATNPGQFYFNILVNDTWPEPQNMTIVYSIHDNFTSKGARPIHVYADLNRTIDITANCTLSDNAITVYNLAPNATAYVTIHLDYALKGTTWTAEEVEAWFSEHAFNAAIRSVSSKVVITDP